VVITKAPYSHFKPFYAYLHATPGAWEALGASYNVLGRHSAALRAFEKAMELSNEDGEGIRPFASAQTGHINLTLGSSVDAVDAYEKALSDGVERVAALFGLASSHLYYAKGALKWGAPWESGGIPSRR
jgi:superkiller protein 3